jgi:hypothetical protein
MKYNKANCRYKTVDLTLRIYDIEWPAWKIPIMSYTINNSSVIWWRSVLLVEETGVPG